jgi:hypothetical protein
MIPTLRYQNPPWLHPAIGALLLALVLGTLVFLGGCSKVSDVIEPVATSLGAQGRGDVESGGPAGAVDYAPPAEIATVSLGSESLRLWPYTGNSFAGTPVDPINVIFAGQADPLEIRAALLALDGDRTAFGLPNAYPFNATWTDATGDVQTNYADGEGWTGSVVQLQLGTYEPARAHLRLFRTGHAFGGGGQWTVGGAHFEILIPGTADHQVLSWELAEQLVTVDMMRTGLLDATVPMMPSGMINAAPSFRDIPDFIYNALPPELIAAIGGPPQPASGAVPIPSDGQAMVFNVAGAATVAPGPTSQTFTLEYNQVVPRPLCADGPYDWILIQGPITFHKQTTLDASGNFDFTADFQGNLTATPVDITQSPPVPTGASFPVIANENQRGFLQPASQMGQVHSRRLAPGRGGTEFQQMELKVGTNGQNSYRLSTKCQDT